MIYSLLAYLLFLACYDHWADTSVHWQVIYFAAQYAFPCSVALIQAVKFKANKNLRITYLMIAMIFAVLVVVELAYINATLESYQTIWQHPPVYLFTAFILVMFTAYEIYIRWKKR